MQGAGAAAGARGTPVLNRHAPVGICGAAAAVGVSTWRQAGGLRGAPPPPALRQRGPGGGARGGLLPRCLAGAADGGRRAGRQPRGGGGRQHAAACGHACRSAGGRRGACAVGGPAGGAARLGAGPPGLVAAAAFGHGRGGPPESHRARWWVAPAGLSAGIHSSVLPCTGYHLPPPAYLVLTHLPCPCLPSASLAGTADTFRALTGRLPATPSDSLEVAAERGGASYRMSYHQVSGAASRQLRVSAGGRQRAPAWQHAGGSHAGVYPLLPLPHLLYCCQHLHLSLTVHLSNRLLAWPCLTWPALSWPGMPCRGLRWGHG